MAKQRPTGSPKNRPVSVPNRSAAAAATKSAASVAWPAFLGNVKMQGWLFFVLAFVLYVNTLTHQFVQDDAIVITDNMFTTQGVKGISGILTKDTFFGFFKVEGKAQLVVGGRYRPFTLVLFALLYQIVGLSPFAFHLLTVLLFAATCFVFYRTLCTLLRADADNLTGAATAWLAALLFTVHPIHTEVVANVKGCDEIVTLLGSLGALWLTVLAYDRQNRMLSVWAALCFLAAALSKENAAAFFIMIPAALWFFRRASWSQIVQYSLFPWLAFGLFFILRGVVMGWQFGAPPPELMNNPYLKVQNNTWVPFSFMEKMATIFYTLGKYVLLLLFPHPLTHDYYPSHIPRMSFGNVWVLLSVALYGFLAYYILSNWRTRDAACYGALFYLAALSIVSNVVFPVGTHMGERFAFMPSAGFCLALGVLLTRLGTRQMLPTNTLLGVAGVVALLFSAKTIHRNFAWKDNDTLFFTDVNTSQNSAKLQNACACTLVDRSPNEPDEAKRQDMYRRAVQHANKAIEVYPTYSNAYLCRGNAQFYLGNFEAAAADYREAIRIEPEKPDYKKNLQLALRQAGQQAGEKEQNLPKAMALLQEAWKVGPDPEVARLLGVANGIGRNAQEAVRWFEKAVELDPKNAAYLYNLGTAYLAIGEKAKGAALQQQAVSMDPKLGQQR